MGAAVGAGIGMAMGGRMAGGPWGAAPGAAAPPPPPPVEKVWHIAQDGQAVGPYGRGHLGRLVADGGLARDSLVWSPGMDGWTAAGEVPDLATLFTVQPPPPPLPKG